MAKKPTCTLKSAATSAWTPAAIREMRKRLELTLKQASHAVGVTLRAWQSWEAKERVPSRQSLILLDLLDRGKIDLKKKSN